MSLVILNWGGIGDTLRHLSQIPHEAIYRRFGLRCKVVYRDWRVTGALDHAIPPDGAVYQELIGRVPSLEWKVEAGEYRGVNRVLNRLVRDAIRLWNGNRVRYFPVRFPLTPGEEAELPVRLPDTDRWFGVLTHLSGMKTKRWGAENWRGYLEALLRRYPKAQITLFDGDPAVRALCFDPRISATCSLSLAQSVTLVERLDACISIDSWLKYAAAWNQIPQVIVVPDQRAEYPHLTGDQLARCEHAGILGVAPNRLIGLEQRGSHADLTLAQISDLTPEQLLEETEELLADCTGVRVRTP